MISNPIPCSKVKITNHEKSPRFLPTATFLHLLLPMHTLSAQTHCLFISEGYPPDRITRSTEHAHTVYGNADAKGIVCSLCAPEPCPEGLQRLNTSIPKHVPPPPSKDGKGNLKDMAACVCSLRAVPSVLSPSSFNSPAFNGLCGAKSQACVL